MSTRASIRITDGVARQLFYRHSDGYPAGALPTLHKFMQWVIAGRIRGTDIEQCSGWLVLIGAKEYDRENAGGGHRPKATPFEPPDWKYGAYEICTHGSQKKLDSGHGDIEWLYILDTKKRTLTVDNLRGVKKVFTETDLVMREIKYDAPETEDTEDTEEFDAPRVKPGASGRGKYYHVEAMPVAKLSKHCRAHDIGRKGHTYRTACKDPKGQWRTQKFMLSKADFDVRGGKMVPVSASAKRWWPKTVGKLGQPTHLKGDVWRFPTHRAPEAGYEGIALPLIVTGTLIGIGMLLKFKK